MATKKKTKKKPTKSKVSAAKKTPAKKVTAKKAPTKKAKTSKKLMKKKPPAKPAPKKKAASKAITRKIAAPAKKQTPKKNDRADVLQFSRQKAGSRSGEESGDLQGLSNVEGADSESVDELLEEGNAFEAGVVRGVEEAGNREEGEVHTHEVPEDDVPGEYLDED
jgi:hypothetical protein